jgi:hypothetical protein
MGTRLAPRSRVRELEHISHYLSTVPWPFTAHLIVFPLPWPSRILQVVKLYRQVGCAILVHYTLKSRILMLSPQRSETQVEWHGGR